MIVILNNGTRIKIEKDFARDIFKTLTEKPATTRGWHITLTPLVDRLLGFNLEQVAAICEEQDLSREPPLTTLKYIGLFLDTLPVEDVHGRFWCEKFRRFVLDPKSII